MFRRSTRRIACVVGMALLVAAAAIPAGAEDSHDLEVTYIGNAGFLISSGKHQVLIDGLYRGEIGGYAAIPPETLEKLEKAEPPYDAIDLVLVTHHHSDHFNAQSVARHLQSNPEARFISTPQAVELLKGAVDDFSTLASRVQAEMPAEGQFSRIELSGIDVTALNLHHGRGLDPPVENLGFLVEFDGKKILHVGDTGVGYEELFTHKLNRQKIDILFIGFWELQRSARWRIFHDVQAERTVAMHIPNANASPNYFGGADSLDAALAKIQSVAPGTVVFTRSLETKTIGPLPEDEPR